jgi:hypothetical protein
VPSHGSRKHVFIYIACGAVVATILLAVFLISANRPHIGADNCVYEDEHLSVRKPTPQFVILIDQSESLTEGHIRGVSDYFQKSLLDDARLVPGTRVLLFTFSKDDFPDEKKPDTKVPSFKPIFAACKPKTKGDPTYENNRRITATFINDFLGPLQQTLQDSLTKEIGLRSPILETIQFIARSQDIDAMTSGSGAPVGHTLVIVSDMLQHTQGFSHYKGNHSFEAFQRGYAKEVQADLSGWNIELLYLRRYKDRKLQQAEHLDFWQQYFHSARGKVARVEGFD